MIQQIIVLSLLLQQDTLNKIQYINHIKFLNDLILKSVHEIFKEDHHDKIIILMSDHGSRLLTMNNSKQIEEQFKNFCMIYTSKGDYSALSNDMTPNLVIKFALNYLGYVN